MTPPNSSINPVLRVNEIPHGIAWIVPSLAGSPKRNLPSAEAVVKSWVNQPGSFQAIVTRMRTPPTVRMTDWMTSVHITASNPPAIV